jgi:hypothetical protein
MVTASCSQDCAIVMKRHVTLSIITATTIPIGWPESVASGDYRRLGADSKWLRNKSVTKFFVIDHVDKFYAIMLFMETLSIFLSMRICISI